MTVRVNKSAFNIREKLSELERPIGVKGSELMRAETAQDARDLVSAGRKNLIINGAMQVAQRGTVVNAGNEYGGPDRFYFGKNDGAFTISQDTDVPSGQGFANSWKADVTSTAGAAGSFYVTVEHRFEGLNLQSIKKGTSNAESLTLSFWIKSTKTGTYIAEFYDNDNNRQISKSYTVNSANTWEKKIITYPADTTGTFGNDNALSLTLILWLYAGSTWTSGTLNDTAWGSGLSTPNRAVGQVNAADNTANNIYITGVQLEVGKNATEFEHRSYGEEFALCQRYYQYVGDLWLHTWSHQIADTGGMRIQQWTYPGGKMRATPTATYYDASSGGNLNKWAVEDPDRLANNTNVSISMQHNAYMSSGGFKYPGAVANFSLGQSGVAVAYRMALSSEL